jgi:ABC-type transport system involved in multi-copper enzyme maturation permease subunit
MRYIFIRELQDLFKDNRIWVFLLVILLITICSGIVSSLNFWSINSQNQYLLQNYENDLEEACRESLQEVSYMDHMALRPVNPNIFLTGDIASRYPNHTYVEIAMSFFGSGTLHIPQKAISSGISSLPFIRYDLLFIVEVLFSFMIMIIAYNSISKEKENKTLSLILSNRISRTSILTGKMLAYSVIAAVSLLLAVIIQLLVIFFMHIIPIDISIISSIGYFLLLSFLYLFFWIVLSICISASVKKSNIALICLIIVWVTIVFIIPSSGRIFLEKWKNDLPTTQELKMKYEQIEKDMWEEAGKNNGGWRGGNLRANAADNHLSERNFAPVYLRWLDVIDDYQYEVITHQIDQVDFLYDYSTVSPSFLYRRIIESINNKGQHEFVDNVRLFRKNLIQSIIEIDNKDNESFHLYFLPNYMSKKTVSRDLIPSFVEVDRTYTNIIHQNIYFILLFLGEILLLFVLSQLIFNKSDIR